MTRSLPGWIFPVGAGVVGLLVGSFLNVVVYRLPLGLSISKPRSFCPTCDRQLEWWENVPVVSWLALRGRCHTCHEPISVRYPLVELSTAGSFAFVTVTLDHSPQAIAYCIWAATLLSITLIDTGGALSPLRLATVGTAAGLTALGGASAWTHDWRPTTGAAIGVVAGAVVTWAVLAGCRTTGSRPWPGVSAAITLGGWLGGLSLVGCVTGVIAAAVGGAATAAAGTLLSASPESGSVRLRNVTGAPMAVGILVGAAVGIIVGG